MRKKKRNITQKKEERKLKEILTNAYPFWFAK